MDALSRTFAALSDPTRRAILARLAQGEATVSQLAEPFAISLPAISRHLRVLQDAQLVERRVDAQWRVCQLQAKPLQEACDWITRYRQFWEHSFDRLAEYLAQTDGSTDTAASDAGKPGVGGGIGLDADTRNNDKAAAKPRRKRRSKS